MTTGTEETKEKHLEISHFYCHFASICYFSPRPPDINMCICCKFLFAIIFPPFAVLITDGFSLQLLINILLTCIFFVPGIIHAIICILRQKKR